MMTESGTKQRIMDLAQDVLRQKGYNGFSYADISAPLGVKNAAIHYHFPKKEDLGVSLISRERRRFKKWTERQAIRELDSAGKINWFLGIYEHFSQGGTRVCYLGALESDFASLPDELQEETRGLNQDLLDWLKGMLQAGQESGELTFEGGASGKALLLLGAVQGAVQMARMTSPAYFTAVIDQIKAELGVAER